MNDNVIATMRKELREKLNNHGPIAGFLTFMILLFLGSAIGPVSRTLKSEFWYWPVGLILVVSVIAGFFASAWKDEQLARLTNAYSDDEVRYHYGRFREKRMRSDFIFYILLALAAAYFIFK